MQPQQKENMVDGQLRPNRVNDPAVLCRFRAVDREDYVPAAKRALAYADQPVPLGPAGRELFSPLLVARLVDSLQAKPSHTVVVLTGGTGYSAALLAGLAGKVVLVEDDPALLEIAHRNLASFTNVVFRESNPAAYAPSAEVNAVLVDAAFSHLPNYATLMRRLVEGGVFAGVRMAGQGGLPQAVKQTKHGKSVAEEVLFETKATCHPAFASAPAFVF